MNVHHGPVLWSSKSKQDVKGRNIYDPIKISEKAIFKSYHTFKDFYDEGLHGLPSILKEASCGVFISYVGGFWVWLQCFIYSTNLFQNGSID